MNLYYFYILIKTDFFVVFKDFHFLFFYCVVVSLTGAVACKNVTEVRKGMFQLFKE